jgi:hypothetical protein
MRIAQVGLDLEIPLLENEEGNWDSFRNLDNKLPEHYDLSKFFPDRIKKPLTFEELQKLDVNA